MNTALSKLIAALKGTKNEESKSVIAKIEAKNVYDNEVLNAAERGLPELPSFEDWLPTYDVRD